MGQGGQSFWKLNLKNNKSVYIRRYHEGDFPQIQRLNSEEGWTNLVENDKNTKEAWEHSNVTFVIEANEEGIVGYIRGLTDTRVTLFICELLIDKAYRGPGIGQKLLKYVHNLYPNTRIKMLATNPARTFYESQGYRPFYGFRKTYAE
jgi:ribosomal protein S18 acetylase RimI-like enzyme